MVIATCARIYEQRLLPHNEESVFSPPLSVSLFNVATQRWRDMSKKAVDSFAVLRDYYCVVIAIASSAYDFFSPQLRSTILRSIFRSTFQVAVRTVRTSVTRCCGMLFKLPENLILRIFVVVIEIQCKCEVATP